MLKKLRCSFTWTSTSCTRRWTHPKGCWRSWPPSAWPRLWGAVAMEAPGLLRRCSNQEAALATLSINPYSYSNSLKYRHFLMYIVFLDYRSITRSKYANYFTSFRQYHSTFFFILKQINKLSAPISSYPQTMTQTVYLRTSRNETREPKPTETWSKANGHRIGQQQEWEVAFRGQDWQGDPWGDPCDEERVRGRLRRHHRNEEPRKEHFGEGRTSSFLFYSFLLWGKSWGVTIFSKGKNASVISGKPDQEWKAEIKDML